jgi:hypothetical protein
VKLAAAMIAAVVVAGCATPEQALLERFFELSRLRDTTALAGIATTVFEPREEGIVRAFRVASVTPERVEESRPAKDVVVEATVSLPGGAIVQKILVVTLRREDRNRGRWLVTGVRDAEASRQAPPT